MLSLTSIFASFFCGFDNFLVFSFSIIGEPSGDLLGSHASLLGEQGFINFFDIRMINVV